MTNNASVNNFITSLRWSDIPQEVAHQTKRCLPGLHGCLCAVQMAEREFTCISPFFDDSPEQAWISSLGREWRIMDQYFKPYAGCRWAQPAIDGALQIIKQKNLLVEDIAQLEVFTFAEAAALPTYYPENTEEAQYNFSFPIAAVLVDGEVGPRQVLERLFDPEIRAVMDKIEIIAEARFQSNFPQKAESEVRITTKNGKKHYSGTVAARWDATYHHLTTGNWRINVGGWWRRYLAITR